VADGEESAVRPGSGIGVIVGVLIALAFVTLRMCDASREAELSNALAGSGLSSRGGGASALGSYVLYLAIATAIVLAISHAFRVPGRAIPIVAIAAIIAGVLLYSSTADIARRRSHAIDTWSICEQPGLSPQGFSVYVWKSGTRTSHEGPHLPGGDPCVEQAEQRDVHVREHPDGNFVDGIQQIMYRFPRDRQRVIYTPALLLLGLVVAVVLTIVHERKRR
jgi:hypothetical protein